MFTGIITDIGTVRAIAKAGDTRFEITTAYDLAGVDMGASIACNGCCLTVIEKGPDWFAIQASGETLSKTTLGQLEQGHPHQSRTRPEDRRRAGRPYRLRAMSMGWARSSSITPEGEFRRASASACPWLWPASSRPRARSPSTARR